MTLVNKVFHNWTDEDLLEEADQRDLNSTECEMLDSMMKQAERRALTTRQRKWLYGVLETRSEA